MGAGEIRAANCGGIHMSHGATDLYGFFGVT
jgi:hypothetical protein